MDKISLTDKEKKLINRYLKTAFAQQATRFEILLCLDEGLSNQEIATKLKCSIPTIQRWKRVYREKGLKPFIKVVNKEKLDEHASFVYSEPKKLNPALTKDEILFLKEVVEKGKLKGLVARSQAILYLNQGFDTHDIARELNSIPSTIEKWFNQFEKERLNSVEVKSRYPKLELSLEENETLSYVMQKEVFDTIPKNHQDCLMLIYEWWAHNPSDGKLMELLNRPRSFIIFVRNTIILEKDFEKNRIMAFVTESIYNDLTKPKKEPKKSFIRRFKNWLISKLEE